MNLNIERTYGLQLLFKFRYFFVSELAFLAFPEGNQYEHFVKQVSLIRRVGKIKWGDKMIFKYISLYSTLSSYRLHLLHIRASKTLWLKVQLHMNNIPKCTKLTASVSTKYLSISYWSWWIHLFISIQKERKSTQSKLRKAHNDTLC